MITSPASVFSGLRRTPGKLLSSYPDPGPGEDFGPGANVPTGGTILLDRNGFTDPDPILIYRQVRSNDPNYNLIQTSPMTLGKGVQVVDGKIRFCYPAGFIGGYDPGKVLWQNAHGRDVYYRSRCYYCDGTEPDADQSWQGHDSGVNKLWFLRRNNAQANNIAVIMGRGPDSQPLPVCVTTESGVPQPATNYQWFTASNEVSPTLVQADLGRGAPFDIELIWIDGTPGEADGELHVWVDLLQGNGPAKILQFTGQTWCPATDYGDGDNRIYDIHYAPTWGGGTNDTVVANQYWELYGFHIQYGTFSVN